jgi:hypothetical protein
MFDCCMYVFQREREREKERERERVGECMCVFNGVLCECEKVEQSVCSKLKIIILALQVLIEKNMGKLVEFKLKQQYTSLEQEFS